MTDIQLQKYGLFGNSNSVSLNEGYGRRHFNIISRPTFLSLECTNSNCAERANAAVFRTTAYVNLNGIFYATDNETKKVKTSRGQRITEEENGFCKVLMTQALHRVVY